MWILLLVWKGSKNGGHFRPQVLAPAVEDIVWSQDSDSWNVSLKILQFDWFLAKLIHWSYPCCVISCDTSSMWPNFERNNCGFVMHDICLKVSVFLWAHQLKDVNCCFLQYQVSIWTQPHLVGEFHLQVSGVQECPHSSWTCLCPDM